MRGTACHLLDMFLGVACAGRSSQAGRDQLIVLLCVDEESGGVVASLEGAPEDLREEMIRE